MISLGIIEGFYGPSWTLEERKDWAEYLSSRKGATYIYAPKTDGRLRKSWRQRWSADDIYDFESLRDIFQKKGVSFGLGLSPWGLVEIDDFQKDEILMQKIQQLKNLSLNKLGLFFDDMVIYENMAQKQIDFAHFIKKHLDIEILFCPSFYTDDPILDKVFGQRPKDYLKTLGEQLLPDISIFWTGTKVISPEISSSHLKKITNTLKRSPIIWDNIFANDGPKNCKFLKLKLYHGRQIQDDVHSIYLNLMNQSYLSMLLFYSASLTLQGFSPEESFKKALEDLLVKNLINFLMKYQNLFLESGLDQIDEEKKNDLKIELDLILLELDLSKKSKLSTKIISEIQKYLQGDFTVSSDCLTD